jgi:transposase
VDTNRRDYPVSTMSSEGKKSEKRSSRQLPKSFKADMVALVLDKEMKPSAVIKQFGLPYVSFYRWLKAARIERGEDPGQELTKSERQELQALRKQVRDLKMEAELVKKWAAFFAKESER